MSANRFGHLFSILSFGESHGRALGAVIDGCPAGINFDMDLLRAEMRRRRPGQSEFTTSRQEADEPEVLSGVFDGKTLGTPIALMVRNTDARSSDYNEIQTQPRVGHADEAWKNKFGHVDWRGGGRSSGRETVARVLGGTVAQMLIRSLAPEVSIVGFSRSIGEVSLSSDEIDIPLGSREERLAVIDKSPLRIPDSAKSDQAEQLLLQAKSEGKSFGGVAELWLDGLPAGLGQPVFRKLKGDLAGAMMSLGAALAIEFDDGFAATRAEGSQYYSHQDFSPGISGGISTGERIVIRVGFKPTSTVMDLAKQGRHDPCIVPRAVPVLEAMCHLVVAEHLLWRKLDRI